MAYILRGNYFLAFFIIAGGCANSTPTSTPAAQIKGEALVHCLLPARVQQLGSMTYASRRALVYETPSRCNVRGGEYTAYDRSTPESSEAFYQAPAAAGNADAQYSLGLVYESLFSPPRYGDAAEWYAKAAEQNHADAMKNLSYLYERGLGVERDQLVALNLLREAGGITDDLVLRSELDAAASAADEEIRLLTHALESQNAETALLRDDLLAVNDQLEDQQQALRSSQEELVAVTGQLSSLGTESGSGNSTEMEALKAQLEENERAVSSRQLFIATLEADVASYKAQLAASERKAQLQEEHLLSELADAEKEADLAEEQLVVVQREKDLEIEQLTAQLTGLVASLQGEQQNKSSLLDELEANRQQLTANGRSAEEVNRLVREVSARDETIGSQIARIAALEQAAAMDTDQQAAEILELNEQISGLREELVAQQGIYGQLQSELERNRDQLSLAESKSTEMDELIAEVGRRSELVSSQAEEIGLLESQLASAGAAISTLKAEGEQQISERDRLQGQLVAKEAELVRAQSSLSELENSLSSEQRERARLAQEVSQLEGELASVSKTSNEVVGLTALLAQRNSDLKQRDDRILALTQEVASKEAQLTSVVAERNLQLASIRTRSLPRTVYPRAPGFKLPTGKKHALIVGNDEYEYLRDLSTAVNGAKAVDSVLREKYGFETRLLLNARRQDVLDALSQLRAELSPEDYVLIYYAGHGERDRRDDEISYWLGVDARAEEMTLSTDGIDSMDINFSVRAMPARHVMIIADSCYSGAMVRPPRVSTAKQNINQRQLEFFVRKRSRTVLTSGGNSPVLDESVDGEHSVFTKALVEVLDKTPDIMYGEALHAALVNLVRYNAEQLDFTQVPQYSEIADADHQNGQFVLQATRG